MYESSGTLFIQPLGDWNSPVYRTKQLNHVGAVMKTNLDDEVISWTPASVDYWSNWVTSLSAGSQTPMEFRILDAGPARPCCVENDSRMFLTRLKSTSTGGPPSFSSCAFAPDKFSCVCGFPCDIRSSACEAVCNDEKKGRHSIYPAQSWWSH